MFCEKGKGQEGQGKSSYLKHKIFMGYDLKGLCFPFELTPEKLSEFRPINCPLLASDFFSLLTSKQRVVGMFLDVLGVVESILMTLPR